MSEQKTDKKLSELLFELKGEYLLKLPGKIQKLQGLNAKQDWTLLEEEFHKLKGTGRTYGYPEISMLSEKLELLAQNKETQIPRLFDQAIDLLSKMLAGYQQGEPIDLLENSTMKTILKLNAQTQSSQLKKGK